MSSVWTLKFFTVIMECITLFLNVHWHMQACSLMCNEGKKKDTISNIAVSRDYLKTLRPRVSLRLLLDKIGEGLEMLLTGSGQVLSPVTMKI